MDTDFKYNNFDLYTKRMINIILTIIVLITNIVLAVIIILV